MSTEKDLASRQSARVLWGNQSALESHGTCPSDLHNRTTNSRRAWEVKLTEVRFTHQIRAVLKQTRQIDVSDLCCLQKRLTETAVSSWSFDTLANRGGERADVMPRLRR